MPSFKNVIDPSEASLFKFHYLLACLNGRYDFRPSYYFCNFFCDFLYIYCRIQNKIFLCVVFNTFSLKFVEPTVNIALFIFIPH